MDSVPPTSVLFCTSDPRLSDQIGRQLTRRGLAVRQVPIGPLDATRIRPGETFDLVIADLDGEKQERWRRAASMRTLFPYLPLLLLAHGQPAAADLERLHPCAYLRKPLENADLEEALDALSSPLP